MSCSLTLTGQLLISPEGCGCSGSSGGGVAPVTMTAKALALGCGASAFAGIGATSCPAQISTPGALGAAWTDLPGTDATPTISLLYVKADLPVRLRFNGVAAQILAGVAYPVTLGAPATLDLEVDGVALAVAFLAQAYTAAQVANAINAAAALAGWTFQPAGVDASTGRPVLRSASRGVLSSVEVVTGVAGLGFTAGIAYGSGAEVTVQGVFLAQFSPALTRVEVSGNARVDVVAAG